MKKLILLLVIFSFVQSTNATHLMGGQLTTKQISNNAYEITLTLYRDVTGIPISPTQTIYVQFPGGSFTTVSIFHNGAVNFLNGVEEYTYSGFFQTGITGPHILTWSDCCRNGAIQNLPAPLSNDFSLVNIFEVDTIAGNSSPEFLNPPVVVASLNDPFTYNPLPFDVDGDSLVWSLANPLEGYFPGSPIAPIPGYTLPSADPTGPFSMDPLTGEITWIPNLQGHFVASFIAEEYRNGVKIGEIRRDMQYIVVSTPGNNNRAQFQTSTWPVDQDDRFSFDLQINDPFTLSVIATDIDNDPISITANGEPLILQNNPAIIQNLSNSIGTASLDFSWTPSPNELRVQPYLVAFRLFETVNQHTLAKDETVFLRVGDFNSVPETISETTIGNIYPVPSNGTLFIPVTSSNASTLAISVFNTIGQQVRFIEKQLNAGQNLIYLPSLLRNNGAYFIKLTVGEISKIEKVVVQ